MRPILILGGAASAVLVVNQVSAAIETRDARARALTHAAQVEVWTADPSSSLPPGTRVHRGAAATVIEGPETMFLVVDGKVIAEAPR